MYKLPTFCVLAFIVIPIRGFVVEISNGQVQGIPLISRNGTRFIGFYGIPYAKPPVGRLRFQAPEEPENWDGIRDPNFIGPRCLQWLTILNVEKVIGQEDCLYLNVFTPSVDKNANIPVIVFIHGGAFLSGGSQEYFPSYFMDKRVVFVTFDYRLGLFGYLSAGDNVLPGNYGMKDQTAALRWVQKNIKQFGGDPKMVTIMGQSAGAASVHFHMFSELSTGLFHRAISESGNSRSPWATVSPEMSRNITFAVGILGGCRLESTTSLVKCLRNVPATDLVKITPKFFVWQCYPSTIFTVVVEHKQKGAFLTVNPFTHSEINQVPWIIGMTSGEGGIVVSELLSLFGEQMVEYNRNYHRLMPITMKYGYTAKVEDIDNITDSIKSHYFGNQDIGLATAFILRDAITDGQFAVSGIHSATRYNNTRYFYYYDHMNERSFNEIFGGNPMLKFLGVCHCDDLISLFPQPWIPELNFVDFVVSERMINYWTNFALQGDPNGLNSRSKIWKPVANKDLQYLHITSWSDSMKSNLLRNQCLFWDSLPIRSKHDATRTKLLLEDINLQSQHEFSLERDEL